VRSILVTPNLLGYDGISCLSRQLLRALPQPAVVLSLHDTPSHDHEGRRSAGGSRARFLADAARVSMGADRETVVVCSHVHLAPVARVLAWRGSPFVQVLCGIEAWVPLRRAERWAAGASRLVAISQHTADRFKGANADLADASIEVCHPGLPVEGPQAGHTGSLDGQPPGVLVVGRMARDEGYKGHELLIDLWPHVLELHPDARLWMVGDGDDRARLESLARTRDVAAAIVFTGRIPDEALEALYRRCRFFVLPSRHEGFGLVFLEAMRAGKACIGARGAAEEIIDHGRTGLIVDPSRPEQVWDAIVKLLDDPIRCDAFGRAGAARFAGAFTDAHFANRLAPVLAHESCEVAHALVR